MSAPHVGEIAPVAARADTPASGLAGLKHGRHDLGAGLQVALLWTPFSLGVALASGAPAIAGLISAIVAGLLYPFLGGSHVTVSGPAAALAPVLLWGTLMLGAGDLAAGYPLVLVAIVLTGALQLLLSALGVGRYASMLPATVIEAMLAAIGIMIILRQAPLLFGAPAVPAKSALEAIVHLPPQLAQAQAWVSAIGVASLAAMFALRRLAARPPVARWSTSCHDAADLARAGAGRRLRGVVAGAVHRRAFRARSAGLGAVRPPRRRCRTAGVRARRFGCRARRYPDRTRCGRRRGGGARAQWPRRARRGHRRRAAMSTCGAAAAAMRAATNTKQEV